MLSKTSFHDFCYDKNPMNSTKHKQYLIMKHCYFEVDITSDSKCDFLIGIKFRLFKSFRITP